MAVEVDELVAGLPEGPATEATVKLQLKITDTTDDVEIALAINAANVFVVQHTRRGKQFAKLVPQPDHWSADLVKGATMMAARIFQRRNSLEGYSDLGDIGAVYVQRNDPDIAMMLGLGAYSAPVVG